jgi:hypothetical protein
MTRALLVEHDPAVGDRAAAALELAGYAVSRCPGPTVRDCPVLGGCGCALVEHADVLVYGAAEAWTTADGIRLLDALRSLYDDRAMVVVGSQDGRAGVDHRQMPHVVRIRAEPSVERLAIAVEDALADR